MIKTAFQPIKDIKYLQNDNNAPSLNTIYAKLVFQLFILVSEGFNWLNIKIQTPAGTIL